MNVEIANRLVTLRKQNNLSQEELAAKLGLSRQAVSKWERAESSPDTDNLIALANLYGVSLDSLLNMTSEDLDDARFATDESNNTKDDTDNPGAKTDEQEDAEYTHINWRDGIHVKDDDSEVHVGWNGIHVIDVKKGEEIHIGPGKNDSSIHINGEDMSFKEAHKKYGHHHDNQHVRSWMMYFPYPVLALIIYFLLGLQIIPSPFNWWSSLLIFLTIPLWYGIAQAHSRSLRERKEREQGDSV